MSSEKASPKENDGLDYDDSFAEMMVPLLRAPSKPVPCAGHFTTVLQHALSRLESGDASILEHFAHVSDEFVTMFDGYPKSKVHLLVMPRRRLGGARELSVQDLPMLRRMAAYTASLLEQVAVQSPSLTWRQGFHANPSLLHLHLHIISDDFDSPCLKNKKHFNSFQPPFLMGIDVVIGNLSSDPPVPVKISKEQAEGLLKANMYCTACQIDFGNRFAELKRHLPSCAGAACRDASAAAQSQKLPAETRRVLPLVLRLREASRMQASNGVVEEEVIQDSLSPDSKRPRSQ